MGLANATATLRGPLPTPDGTASVRQDQRKYFVLRFASAGSKGSTQEDVVRGIYDGRTVLDAPALLSGVVLALIPTGNVPWIGSFQRACVGSYPSRQRCGATSLPHSAATRLTT